MMQAKELLRAIVREVDGPPRTLLDAAMEDHKLEQALDPSRVLREREEREERMRLAREQERARRDRLARGVPNVADELLELFIRPRCSLCNYRSKTAVGPKKKGVCVWCARRVSMLEAGGDADAGPAHR